MKPALAMLVVHLGLMGAPIAARAASPDIVLADFEGRDYGNWKASGEAFGPGPAQGTLPHQMTVSGYRGHGLVNSFYGGDRSTGTLTSPEFKIERRYITFLIGGGGWEGKTCMNLLVDGSVVRTATGPNTRPGGSEALETVLMGRGRSGRQDGANPDRRRRQRRLGTHQRGPDRPHRSQAARAAGRTAARVHDRQTLPQHPHPQRRAEAQGRRARRGAVGSAVRHRAGRRPARLVGVHRHVRRGAARRSR